MFTGTHRIRHIRYRFGELRSASRTSNRRSWNGRRWSCATSCPIHSPSNHPNWMNSVSTPINWRCSDLYSLPRMALKTHLGRQSNRFQISTNRRGSSSTTTVRMSICCPSNTCHWRPDRSPILAHQLLPVIQRPPVNSDSRLNSMRALRD